MTSTTPLVLTPDESALLEEVSNMLAARQIADPYQGFSMSLHVAGQLLGICGAAYNHFQVAAGRPELGMKDSVLAIIGMFEAELHGKRN